MRHQLNPQLTPLPPRRRVWRAGFGDVGTTLKQQAAATAAQTAIANAPQSVQDAWNQATSDPANASRISGGISAAQSLIQNGYDQNNPDDEKKLIAVIAAGVSLIPGWGILLAGALETLNEIAEWIGGALQDIGLIPKPGCHSSGTFTTANVLANWQGYGADMTPGTFAAFAWPAFAYNSAIFHNCQKGAFDNQTLLMALVNAWNQSTTGSPAAIYVPPFDGLLDEPWSYLPQSGQASVTLADGKGGLNNPLAAIFHPASDFNAGALPQNSQTVSVNVNVTTTSTAAGATASKAGPAVGGAIAAAAVGTAVYGYVKGRAVGSMFESAFASLTALFK
jgi:hypothetical protein